MRKILVRHEGYEVHLIDGEFRCPHLNVEVISPCCSSVGSSGYIECGCGGKYSVYCPDCQNEDLRDYEINDIIEKELEKYE